MATIFASLKSRTKGMLAAVWLGAIHLKRASVQIIKQNPVRILAAAAILYAALMASLALSYSPRDEFKAFLSIGERELLWFSLFVAVGVVGENRTPDKGTWLSLSHTAFAGMVALGVAGELMADGGVYWASSRLQTIEELAVAEAENKAGQANERAATALKQAADLGVTVDNLNQIVQQKAAEAKAAIADLERAKNDINDLLPRKIFFSLADPAKMGDPSSSRIVISFPPNAPEQQSLAQQIAQFIGLGGHAKEIVSGTPNANDFREGVSIEYRPSADGANKRVAMAICHMLDKSHVDVSVYDLIDEFDLDHNNPPDTGVRIHVGTRHDPSSDRVMELMGSDQRTRDMLDRSRVVLCGDETPEEQRRKFPPVLPPAPNQK